MNDNNSQKMSSRHSIRQSIKRFLKPKIIQEWTVLWKDVGFWGLVKQKGWKIVITIIIFYLIRDSFLYILLPYLIARGVF